MPSNDLCGDWRRGVCRRGSGCKFRHEGEGGPQGGGDADNRDECGDYKRGVCRRGSSCKYSHIGPPMGRDSAIGLLGAMSSMFGAGALRLGPSLRDDRAPCGDFKSGRCQRGVSCKFSHLTAGDKLNMEAWGSVAECGDFLQGRCQRGAGCKFAHLGTGGKIVTACADYRMGKCDRGSGCRFAHVDDDEQLQRPLCGDFKNGNCHRGSDCRFSHDDRTKSRSRSRSRARK
eukprot:TRINITY_DN6881_c0_g1_i4.p1 TRINITY_DN6881_c0_g1~~TRINITY_DN6881_c0_g1_i4.p1  ORF type:complete len:230 (+),score=33.41 TRINITY_DN6881_c0_g1_i4:140-829(+)